MRAFYSDSWKAFPDGRAELHDGPFLHPRAPRFSNVWRWTGTHTGPLERMGLAATGKRVELLAFEVVEVRDGLASSVRIVENMADVMAQLGLLPTPGSGA